jgi:hypothetical protein
MEALGHLRQGADLGRRVYTRSELRDLLREAASAPGTPPETRKALSRFGALHPRADSVLRPRVGLSLIAASTSPRHDPGYFLRRQWRDPVQRPGASSVRIGANAWVPLGARTVASLTTAHGAGSDLSVEGAYLHRSLGSWNLWGGRHPVALGMRGPETQLLAGARIDGASVRRARPLHLPGPLRRVGAVTGEAFFGRPVGDIGSYRDPFLSGARVAFRPSHALTIGLNRVSLFGGEGNEAITPKNVMLMLMGFTSYFGKDTSFENSLASADLTLITRVARTPLVLSGEWAFEDVGFSFLLVPGISLRAELPSVPALPDWSAAASHTRMARSCCGYPSWYHHMDFGAGWVLDRQPLGHPLGGHGDETRISAARSPLLGGVGVALGAGRRVRGRQNIYAPTLIGESWVFDAALEVGVSGRIRLGVAGAAEIGGPGGATHGLGGFARIQ